MDQMTKEAYHRLLEDEQPSSVDEEIWVKSTPLLAKSKRTRTFVRYLLPLLLSLSLLANLVLTIALQRSKALANSTTSTSLSQPSLHDGTHELAVSTYAGLSYSTNGTWESETKYTQENLTLADEAWTSIKIPHAFVAFKKDHAKTLNLPESLTFPWDNKKDLYLVTSIHSMHCLTVLHRSNLEYRSNHTQTYATEHILHCLDNLRADIECHADDTPRSIPPGASESTVKTGVGQNRQCRDWAKLNEWAEEHGACFRYNEFLRRELEGKLIYPEAFQYCGKGNEYLARVQGYMNEGPDWVADEPEWPEIDLIQEHYSPASGIS